MSNNDTIKFSSMREYFANLEDKIASEGKLTDFNPHNPDKGANREQVLIDILNAHLPRRLKAIRGGVIINLDGKKSKQMDIIIVHDIFTAFGAIANPVVIAEAVVGVMEVKSKLTKTDTENTKGGLVNAIKNLASVPPMTRDALGVNDHTYKQITEKLPFRAVYAYKCDNQETLYDKTLELLNGKNRDEQSKFPDVIAVNHKISMTRSFSPDDPKLIGANLEANPSIRGMPMAAILSALSDTVSFLPHMKIRLNRYVHEAFKSEDTR